MGILEFSLGILDFIQGILEFLGILYRNSRFLILF